MSVRLMSFTEFFNRCLTIKQSNTAPIDKFGDPMNCYGMVYWFYKLCLGIELERTRVERLEDVHRVQYKQVDIPQDGDVVYMITPTSPNEGQHIGICVNNIVYHFTYDGLRSESRFKMQDVIRGYYRYVDAC